MKQMFRNNKMKELSVVFNKKIDIYGKIPYFNELNEKDFKDGKLKTVWAAIIPQTSKLQTTKVETIVSNTTHKIIIRYSSGKDITQHMKIMYKGHKFDINYILNPNFENKYLEMFCQEVIE